ncbi:MAG: alanine racemase [Gemmatimonadota bacterium]
MIAPSTRQRSRAWVEVRLDRLRENAASAQRALGADAGLVPMVKAEAYGLGLAPIAAALRDFPKAPAPWAFGVAAVAEGERLRADGWDGRILVFSPASPLEYRRAVEAELTLCLSDLAAVGRLADVATELGRELPFHLEIDTGMGRAGFPWADAANWGAKVAAAADGHLRWEGTFTHFHSADEPDPAPTEEQWERFQRAVEALPAIVPVPLSHVANSAGILRFGGFGCNLARPGIYLYGGRAGPGTEPAPVVSLRACLVLVRQVQPGATAGYGATYQASQVERWGTLAVGYGDGVPRALAGGGHVLVRGRRVPIVGRLSMDMITVDLSSVPGAEVGDVATLIGEDGGERITVDDVAGICGTISYEILTRLGTRLPRVYLDGEHDTGVAG